MPNPDELQVFYFRKRITTQFQLRQLQILCTQWGVTMSEVCCRLISDGIIREKQNREANGEIKKILNEVPNPEYNSPSPKD